MRAVDLLRMGGAVLVLSQHALALLLCLLLTTTYVFCGSIISGGPGPARALQQNAFW
jgi:hypothetical protein